MSDLSPQPSKLGRIHSQRLRAMYRSAGWPCLDTVEVELLVAGLLERVASSAGMETVRVTDAGLKHIADSLMRNRAALDAHEALVQRVAGEQARNDRIVYTSLALRAKPAEDWLVMRPDVFSIRNTTVEDYVEPIIHEIKVRRADLLSDLKKPEKRGGYMALSSEFYFVLAEGIAKPEEIPEDCGVIVARNDGVLERVRCSPKRAARLGFATWMALAKAERLRGFDEPTPGL
ncbi:MULTISPECIES: hypothetical protein [Hydrocarboniphaga]|nr:MULTISPECIES: hypothetical protein [Hydrocarboniphaga]MDZ4077405.1 hypothetical protein [Hydrocarboniphaga sp.]